MILTPTQIRDFDRDYTELLRVESCMEIYHVLSQGAGRALFSYRAEDFGLDSMSWYACSVADALSSGSPIDGSARRQLCNGFRYFFVMACCPRHPSIKESRLSLWEEWLRAVEMEHMLDRPASELAAYSLLDVDAHPGLCAMTTREVLSLPYAKRGGGRLMPSSRTVSRTKVAQPLRTSLCLAGLARVEREIVLRTLLPDLQSWEGPLGPWARSVAGELQRWSPLVGTSMGLWTVLEVRGLSMFTLQATIGEESVTLHRSGDQVRLSGDASPSVQARVQIEIFQELRAKAREIQSAREWLEFGLPSQYLRSILPEEAPAKLDESELGWRLTERKSGWTLVPMRISPGRGKSSNKMISLEEAQEYPLREQDRKVLRALEVSSLLLAEDRSVALAQAIESLEGHPHFFVGSGKGRPGAVRRKRLRCRLTNREQTVQVRWEVGDQSFTSVELIDGAMLPFDAGLVPIVMVHDENVWILPVDDALSSLIRTYERIADTAPLQIADGLIDRLASMPDLDLSVDPSMEGTVYPPDSTPILQLTGHDEDVTVELRVRPGRDRRSFPPAEGALTLRGTDPSGRWTVHRSFQEERRQAAERWSRLGLDLPMPSPQLSLDLDEAVAFLSALSQESPPGRVVWSGQRRTVNTASPKDLKLTLKTEERLVSIGGELEIDDWRLPIHKVLRALRDGRRFVEVDRERILHLGQELAERLENLAAASWSDRQGDEKLSMLGADVIDELQEIGAEIESPPQWDHQRAELRRARAIEPVLPADLQATLRGYQVEGVQWLLRLGQWGLGGVLADDMGLGKTVQALAVLLARGAEGPALVVAPTSVVGTWRREAGRFAPRLRVEIHHGSGRARDLDHLGADDLLVTSWGTLVQDRELLAGCRFRTVVLDEAHAVKNASTRRAQAARALQADFIIALTGTPVENRPGELWSLMRVVAPGLLGSQEGFNERFATPILIDPHSQARDQLARLIKPFILRRTKSAVALDLPARQEVVVEVDLDFSERAFYEGVRRAGLQEIPDVDVGAIAMLKVLLRLRQAAICPALIDDSFHDSSKLKAVRRTLRDLREAGHKALVFSFFVSVLDLLAPTLEAEGFRIGRIDGSVTRIRREQVVEDFQAGSLDLLLISLQAGGTGLTLTAASYVLHIDPWWNPAQQDQATDRAHRIGQTQPVTVLHFLARQTIEMGMRKIQEEKREMVAALLDGTGGAGKLDAEALLALIREEHDEEPQVRSAEVIRASSPQPAPASPAPSVPALATSAPSELAPSSPAPASHGGSQGWIRLEARYSAWFERAGEHGTLAPSTSKSYQRYWQRFVALVDDRPVPSDPGTLDQLLTQEMRDGDAQISSLMRAAVRKVVAAWSEDLPQG